MAKRAQRNFDFNAALPPVEGLLNGQGLSPLADYRYGRCSMGRSGCGLIACYNALRLLGEPMALSALIRWGEEHGSPVLGAYLGTFPGIAKKLFSARGYRVEVCRRPQDFDAALSRARVGLFTYWNRKGHPRSGIHTVCLRALPQGLEIYNLRQRSPQAVQKPSFARWIQEGIGPIVLYLVYSK